MRLSPKPEQAQSARRTAWALSLAGYVPFAFLAFVLVIDGRYGVWGELALDALLTYGAVILSFMGGVRWGAAIADRVDTHRARDVAVSVVPSLVGWAALFMPSPVGLAVLALAFAAQGAWDAFSAQKAWDGLVGEGGRGVARLPPWFGRLRIVLTLLVVGALVAALVAIA